MPKQPVAKPKPVVIEIDKQPQNANWLKVPKGVYTKRPTPKKGREG